MRPRRSQSVFLLALIVSALAPPRLAHDGAQPLEEHTLKALYTYQLGKVTEWPATKLTPSEANLNFCILGKNPFGSSALDAIQNKWVQGRPLRIEIYPSGLLSKEAIVTCHILFISESEKSRFRSILAQLHGSPVLTVSDIDNFAAQGGMIALVKLQEQVRLEINSMALRQSGLAVSSKLLELAKLVPEPRPGAPR
ncbi:MAG: YfiR family protein [Gammaproteobacteria bacterium]